MKWIILLLLTFPIITFGQDCEVPKEKIIIADVGLGQSVVELAKKHKGINLQTISSDENNSNLGTLNLTQDVDKYWLMGTPISSFIYIGYNKRNNLINGYNISFNLDGLSPKKFKNVLVEMYDLPKNGWMYKVDDSDPKYGEEHSYTYKCKDYTIYMSQSGFGNTMSINLN